MIRRRFLTLAACALATPALAAEAHRWQGTALGADVALTVKGGSERAARAFFAESARALRHVEEQFSLYRGSALTRLNAMGHLPHPSDDMLTLLALAGRVHEATGGAFDPTVQPLWQVRRLGQDETAARALTGWGEIRISRAEIRLNRPGMALTLNGIAQGFAADRLAEVARRHGLTDLLIDAGEARALGRWTARIETPEGRAVRALTLLDQALATSAPYGTRIGPDAAPHIVSLTRQPVWALVSVTAPTAAEADALSTAAVLLDRPALDRALAAFPGARLAAAVPLS